MFQAGSREAQDRVRYLPRPWYSCTSEAPHADERSAGSQPSTQQSASL